LQKMKTSILITLLFLSTIFTVGKSAYFVSYIDKMTSWWPPSAIAAGIGVPGYAWQSNYNVLNLAFWTSNTGPVDVALLWSNAYYYVSSENPWGSNTAAVQKAWINLYHRQGIKVLVSAFGSTDFPTSQGVDPVTCGINLANFVRQNNFDGVDLDWEDNEAMNQGKGEAWLITITQTLRARLPRSEGYIISHAPQAPYFMGKPRYPNGGYLTIDQSVGNLIDFYNIQFYNQDSSAYSTYQTLFVQSDGWATGTSVLQIAGNIKNMTRCVIGKPVTTGDVNNSGYVPLNTLRTIVQQGIQQTGWKAGLMSWQYPDDHNGQWINTLSAVF